MFEEALLSDGLNKSTKQVEDFHTAFGHPVADKPTIMPIETAVNRLIWDAEESVELLHATVRGDEMHFRRAVSLFVEGIIEAMHSQINKGIEYKTDEEVLVAQADALTDKEYFNKGNFVVMGIKRPQMLFDIVQNANMGKLHNVDGVMKAVYREDGKIQKPENWERDFAPESKLRRAIQKMGE